MAEKKQVDEKNLREAFHNAKTIGAAMDVVHQAGAGDYLYCQHYTTLDRLLVKIRDQR